MICSLASCWCGVTGRSADRLTFSFRVFFSWFDQGNLHLIQVWVFQEHLGADVICQRFCLLLSWKLFLPNPPETTWRSGLIFRTMTLNPFNWTVQDHSSWLVGGYVICTYKRLKSFHFYVSQAKGTDDCAADAGLQYMAYIPRSRSTWVKPAPVDRTEQLSGSLLASSIKLGRCFWWMTWSSSVVEAW